MPTVTSKGYFLPNNGERGTWWSNLIANFLRLDGHKHDGLDSQLLDARNIQKQTQDLSAASWVSLGDGSYEQEVTLPTSITFAKLSPTFIVNGGDLDGSLIHLGFEKSDTNKFKVFINDNTLAIKVIYA